MLPDFKSPKMKLEQSVIEIFNDKAQQSPFLSQINKKVLFEGKRTSFVDSCGDYIENELEKVESKFSVKQDEILEKGVVIFIEKFLGASGELKEKTIKGFLQKVDDATSKTGNKLDASEKLITEFYLEGLKKIPVDFDDDGNPFLPSLAMHPDTLRKHNDLLSEYLKKNPKHMEEYEKEFKKIIEMKRKEWYDRESNRKLVD